MVPPSPPDYSLVSRNNLPAPPPMRPSHTLSHNPAAQMSSLYGYSDQRSDGSRFPVEAMSAPYATAPASMSHAWCGYPGPYRIHPSYSGGGYPMGFLSPGMQQQQQQVYPLYAAGQSGPSRSIASRGSRQADEASRIIHGMQQQQQQPRFRDEEADDRHKGATRRTTRSSGQRHSWFNDR